MRLIVDFRTVRCESCKSKVKDVKLKQCPSCGVSFTGVHTNHIGLGDSIRIKRNEKPTGDWYDPADRYPEMVSS